MAAAATGRRRTSGGRAMARAVVVGLALGVGGVGALAVAGAQDAPEGPFVEAAAASPGASSYVPLVPTRILDTREGLGTGGVVAPLGDHSSIDVAVAGQGGVPAGATAVVLNVTVTEPDDNSYLTVWPTGEPRPTASNLNWVVNRTIPNLVVARLGAGGQVSMYNDQGRTHVIADVAGYYEGAAPGGLVTGAGAPNASTPASDGDLYLNTNNNQLYGPRTGGTWPSGVRWYTSAAADATFLSRQEAASRYGRTWFATVNAGGGVVSSRSSDLSNAAGVQVPAVAVLGPGLYRVDFSPVDVSRCAVATSITSLGAITAAAPVDSSVLVSTYNIFAGPEGRDFSVVVTCD